MSSILYVLGAMGQFIVVEQPDVVQEKIEAAEESGEDWIHLHSQGVKVQEVGEAEFEGKKVKVGELADSFTEFRVRHAGIYGIRESHPGEVREP